MERESEGFQIAIDPESLVPPYEQIVAAVVDAIQQGRAVAGMKLPTVRALAAELGLATNTVAKAYRQLESEGHVRTEGRRGTVIQAAPRSDAVRQAALGLISAARGSGLTLDETLGVVRSQW